MTSINFKGTEEIPLESTCGSTGRRKDREREGERLRSTWCVTMRKQGEEEEKRGGSQSVGWRWGGGGGRGQSSRLKRYHSIAHLFLWRPASPLRLNLSGAQWAQGMGREGGRKGGRSGVPGEGHRLLSILCWNYVIKLNRETSQDKELHRKRRKRTPPIINCCFDWWRKQRLDDYVYFLFPCVTSSEHSSNRQEANFPVYRTTPSVAAAAVWDRAALIASWIQCLCHRI